jgi:hypothetical protein
MVQWWCGVVIYMCSLTYLANFLFATGLLYLGFHALGSSVTEMCQRLD